MKMGMTRLRKNLISIEAETATVLKEANTIREQHKVYHFMSFVMNISFLSQ